MAQPLSERIRQSWQGKGWLSTALLPLSWLYGAAVVARRGVHRLRHREPAARLPAFVIVVGNVVAGGAGKTPVTIALVRALQQRGWPVGVVSRGYGRTGEDCRPVRPDSHAREVGDEPLLIHRNTGAPVFVAARRMDAVRALLHACPQTRIIVSDDGLQHLALPRDFEICVFHETGIQNGRLLPAGPLREPWPRAVDAVLYRAEASPAIRQHPHAWPVQRQLAAQTRNGLGEQRALRDWAATPVLALAGIAEPQAFFTMLEARGLVLAQRLALPDHADDAALRARLPLLQQAVTQGVPVLCTEKDSVKLWPLFPQAYAVPLQVELPTGLLEQLAQRIDRVLPAISH